MNLIQINKAVTNPRTFIEIATYSILIMIICHFPATALMPDITLGWSVFNSFLIVYLSVWTLFTLIRFWEIYYYEQWQIDDDFSHTVQSSVKYIRHFFGYLLLIQICWYIGHHWYTEKLFPLGETSFLLSLKEILLYIVGHAYYLVFSLAVEVKEFIEQALQKVEICFMGVCLSKYPLLAPIVGAVVIYVVNNALKIRVIRFIAKKLFVALFKGIVSLLRLLQKRISIHVTTKKEGQISLIIKHIWEEIKAIELPKEWHEMQAKASENK